MKRFKYDALDRARLSTRNAEIWYKLPVEDLCQIFHFSIKIFLSTNTPNIYHSKL